MQQRLGSGCKWRCALGVLLLEPVYRVTRRPRSSTERPRGKAPRSRAPPTAPGAPSRASRWHSHSNDTPAQQSSPSGFSGQRPLRAPAEHVWSPGPPRPSQAVRQNQVLLLKLLSLGIVCYHSRRYSVHEKRILILWCGYSPSRNLFHRNTLTSVKKQPYFNNHCIIIYNSKILWNKPSIARALKRISRTVC